MTAPTTEQKLHQYQAGKRAIDTICEAWPEAQSAAASRGYPTSSPGPRAAAGVVKDTDALHTRQMPPASAKVATFGDATGNAALQFDDAAENWLSEVRGTLGLLLRLSPNHGVWNRGQFHPPSFHDTLTEALSEVVDWWPRNVERLLAKLQGLANTARREWPSTPETGQKVGQVVVGQRADLSEVCVGCHEVIGGGADDPIRRVDGAPYHLNGSGEHGSCWTKARKAAQRARAKETAA